MFQTGKVSSRYPRSRM